MAAGGAGEELQVQTAIYWSRPPTEGAQPAARGGHTAELVENLMVVFGGTYLDGGKFIYCSDLWALETDSSPLKWHKITSSGSKLPGGRYGHTSCRIDHKVYIFGGKGEGGIMYNDLWELDIERWAWRLMPTTSAPPSPRMGHSAIAISGKLLVFGGWDGKGTANNDLWVYDRGLLQWTRPKTSGPPPCPRQGAAVLLDPRGGRLLFFGGASYDAHGVPTYLKDVRQLDLLTMQWSSPRVGGDYPPARHMSAVCAVENVGVIHGGWHGSTPHPPAESSTITMPHAPGMGFGAEAPPNSVITVPYGAHSGTAFIDLDAGEWVAPSIAGKQPGYRYGCSAVASGLRAFIWGGWEDGRPTGELLVLDVSALAAAPAE